MDNLLCMAETKTAVIICVAPFQCPVVVSLVTRCLLKMSLNAQLSDEYYSHGWSNLCSYWSVY